MIPAERAHLSAYAITHPGMSGKNNEDRYAVAAFRTEGEKPLPVLFAIVSDGIGGHRAGEIASEMVVETISREIARSNGSNPVQTLRESIMRASQEILVQAESDPEKKGMGATCVCALIIDDRIYIASVGDSRVYLRRNGKLQQLSIDHTWVQEAIDAGLLSREESKEHPNAHVIRRYLGSKQPVEPDTRLRLATGESNARSESNQGLHLRPNDQILLCSDGLTDLVSDDEINSMVADSDQEKAIEKLVDLANQRGGHDNITIVLLNVPEMLPDATQPISLPAIPEKNKRSSRLIRVITVALIAILIALAGSAYYLYIQSAIALPTVSPQATIWQAQPSPTPSAVEDGAGAQPTGLVTMTPLPTVEITTQPTSGTPKPTLTAWPTNTGKPYP
jgi:PPM family protein phosphatase